MFHARLRFLFFPVVVCSLLVSCFIAKAQTEKPDRLVYVSNRDYPNIYAMNVDGTGVKRLTSSKRIEIDPSWSPDHQRILFVTIEEDKTSLSVFDTKLSKQTRLYQARSGASILGPMWSPNGLTIFFSQSGTSSVAPFNLYKMDADGKNVKSLGAGVLPSISPDGKTLLYTSMESGGKVFNLNLMDIEGANTRTLVQNAIGGAWSPDGKFIAYISTVPPGGVTIAKADGTEPRLVVPVTTPHIPCRPVWSRDGKRLYFSRIPLRDDGLAKRDICAVDVSGKNFKRLTNDDFDNELGEGTSFFAILKQASDKARASKGP